MVVQLRVSTGFLWMITMEFLPLRHIIWECNIKHHEIPSPTEPQPQNYSQNYEINLPAHTATITKDIDIAESTAARKYDPHATLAGTNFGGSTV
jgi:hypothetical protein